MILGFACVCEAYRKYLDSDGAFAEMVDAVLAGDNERVLVDGFLNKALILGNSDKYQDGEVQALFL